MSTGNLKTTISPFDKLVLYTSIPNDKKRNSIIKKYIVLITLYKLYNANIELNNHLF